MKNLEQISFEKDMLAEMLKKQNLEVSEAFYSGILVALQSISMFDEPTIAEEIISGLGIEADELARYARMEGGIDGSTIDWLVSTGAYKE
ncbi:hypothetical protein NVP1121O_260 [Vibrio phage 1.121.O._10N.286.46.C4]|nr:hypothetical protein NVP1121O_260 [Vibrio phage 1.121.O._10N.286.46.C4]